MPFPDPFTTIAAMAAVTTKLRFGTLVYILPLRHPLEVAKAVGTAAVLSNDRVVLGCGAGWIREEYDALGVDFATRGKRYDEMIDVLRKAWSGDMVEHRGAHFDLGSLPDESRAARAGADLDRRRRRTGAAARGDARRRLDRQRPEPRRSAARSLTRLRELRPKAGREAQPFEALVPLTTPPDADTFARLGDAGMTATTRLALPLHARPHLDDPAEARRDAAFRRRRDREARLSAACPRNSRAGASCNCSPRRRGSGAARAPRARRDALRRRQRRDPDRCDGRADPRRRDRRGLRRTRRGQRAAQRRRRSRRARRARPPRRARLHARRRRRPDRRRRLVDPHAGRQSR